MSKTLLTPLPLRRRPRAEQSLPTMGAADDADVPMAHAVKDLASRAMYRCHQANRIRS